MMSRFKRRKIGLNKLFKDEEIFTNRGVEQIRQYTTPKMKNPTEEELMRIPYEVHYWGAGDRYFKLAQRYYNDHNMLYIIALFNQKPTEGQIIIGEEIKIPTDLQIALEILG